MLHRSLRAACPLVLLALIPSVVSAAPVCVPSGSHGGILTGVADQFSTTTSTWGATALRYAQDLFFLLVGIEIAWSGITYVLQKDSLPDFIAALLLKILGVGFFYILLQPGYGPVWIADILSSFTEAGSAIGGQPTFATTDPSAVFTCGTDISGAMLASVSKTGFGLSIVPAIEAWITALVAALGVTLAFAIVAGQLLITLIESYIIIGAGIFMLGFTGSRWSLVLGEKYVGYAISVGIKLFMLELIVGLGYGLGSRWAALFAGGIAPPETYIEVAGAALIFGFLAWQIPSLAATLMNGAPSMTLGSFINTTGAVAIGSSIVGGGVLGMLASRGGGGAIAIGSDSLQRAATIPPSDGASRGAGEGAYLDYARQRPSLAGNAPSTSTAADGGPMMSRYGEDNSSGLDREPMFSETTSSHSSPTSPPDDDSDDGDGGSSTREVGPKSPRSGPSRSRDVRDASAGKDVRAAESSDAATTTRKRAPSDAGSGEAQRSDPNDQGGVGASSRSRQFASDTDAEVTASDAADAQAVDAEIGSEDADAARRADLDAARAPQSDPSHRSLADRMQSLRQPPVPDDSAAGSVHIRFSHPD